MTRKMPRITRLASASALALALAAPLALTPVFSKPAHAFFGFGGIVYDPTNHAENLLTAAAFGRDLPERQVADDCAAILRDIGLAARANQLAGSLTLLDRKRLELGRAMATAPEILLLDEIAGGLTEAECHTLIATIRGLQARGVTIIWIEHVLHALTSVVERLLVLDFGRVIGLGAPADIMASRDVREIYLGIEA